MTFEAGESIQYYSHIALFNGFNMTSNVKKLQLPQHDSRKLRAYTQKQDPGKSDHFYYYYVDDINRAYIVLLQLVSETTIDTKTKNEQLMIKFSWDFSSSFDIT